MPFVHFHRPELECFLNGIGSGLLVVAPDPCTEPSFSCEAQAPEPRQRGVNPSWGEGRAGGSRGLSREGQKERPEGPL